MRRIGPDTANQCDRHAGDGPTPKAPRSINPRPFRAGACRTMHDAKLKGIRDAVARRILARSAEQLVLQTVIKFITGSYSDAPRRREVTVCFIFGHSGNDLCAFPPAPETRALSPAGSQATRSEPQLP